MNKEKDKNKRETTLLNYSRALILLLRRAHKGEKTQHKHENRLTSAILSLELSEVKILAVLNNKHLVDILISCFHWEKENKRLARK